MGVTFNLPDAGGALGVSGAGICRRWADIVTPSVRVLSQADGVLV